MIPAEHPAAPRPADPAQGHAAGGRVPPQEPTIAPRTYRGVERRIRALTTAPARRGLVASGAGAVLALAALVDPWLVALVMIGLQVWFATGWMRLLGLPSVRPGGVVAVIVGVVAVLGSLGTRDAQQLVLAVAAGLIAAFVAQMLRTDGRPRLVEDLGGIVGGVVAVTCGAGWVIVADHHPLVTIAGAGALAAAAAVSATPWQGRRVIAVGIPAGVLGAAVGGVVVRLLGPLLGLPGFSTISSSTGQLVVLALLGAAVGAVTTTLQVLLTWLPRSGRRRPAAAAALLPVLLVGVPLELVSTLVPR